MLRLFSKAVDVVRIPCALRKLEILHYVFYLAKATNATGFKYSGTRKNSGQMKNVQRTISLKLPTKLNLFVDVSKLWKAKNAAHL